MKYLMMDFNVLFVLSFIVSLVNKKFEEEEKTKKTGFKCL